MVPAIETDKLTKVYRTGATRAVDELSLSVPAGEVFGFLGPNGAGKTTTIYLLLGILKPTSGGGTILGRPLGDTEAKERIGFLPESATMHMHHTGLSLLHFYGELLNMRPLKLKARSLEVLEQTGLAKVKDNPITTYSKGMLQRLGLAQALLNEPELLILDEPTANLDPLGRKEVKDLLLSLKGGSRTIFISSHILSDVEQLCDSVGILAGGKLLKCGKVHELTSEKENLEEFFYRTVTGGSHESN